MVSISTKRPVYQSCVWSPCGHFVAAMTKKTVEIRGALALNPLFTLKSTGVATKFWHGLAYSPDGHSLACCSSTAIIIWDTQTGGVVRKIDCEVGGNGDSLELVWSLEGNLISIISALELGTLTVCVYEVTSGTMQSSGTAKSTGSGCLWAHDKSFWVMTMTRDDEGSTINIYETGSTLTKVKQFNFRSHTYLGVFSPTTYRITVDWAQDPLGFFILDLHSSEVLLQVPGYHWRVTFSPDGNLVAAFTGSRLLIWRYTPGHYTQWRELQNAPSLVPKFSPTSSSILGCSNTLLHVLHLDHSPTAPTIESGATIHSVPWDAMSPHSVYIVTVHRGESTITVTNLHSQNPSPSQFIDTGLKILGIVLTGNVLLVNGSGTVVAWLLTEEGVVGGTFGERRVDCSNQLWDVPYHKWGIPVFSVDGGIGVIWFGSARILGNSRSCIYNTKTGKVFLTHSPDRPSTHRGPRYSLQDSPDGFDLYYRVSRQCHRPPKWGWPVSKATLREGWVKDPEGKHRLWLHPRWRSP